MTTVRRTIGGSVLINVDVDEVLEEIKDTDLVQECKNRGLAAFTKSDVEELRWRLHRGDLVGALEYLDALLPVGARHFARCFATSPKPLGGAHERL